jgi:hypothetical protein
MPRVQQGILFFFSNQNADARTKTLQVAKTVVFGDGKSTQSYALSKGLPNAQTRGFLADTIIVLDAIFQMD